MNDQIEKTNVHVSLWLDTRRALQSGDYPLKLRVYYNGEQRLINFAECTKIDFENYCHVDGKGSRPKGNKKNNKEWAAFEKRANETAQEMDDFDFDELQRLLGLTKDEVQSVKFEYKRKIEELKKDDNIGTASSYECSMKSLEKYCSKIGKDFVKLRFKAITPEFLKNYEKWMTKNEARSKTTVGIYLRALRGVFNQANQNGINYPFHKRGDKNKYSIPKGSPNKRALDQDQLKTLYSSTAANDHQEKARFFWFFTYSANGMNIRDLVNLRWKNIQDGKIKFIRNKTKNTVDEPEPIVVMINPLMQKVIDKYGIRSNLQDDYVFPFCTPNMTETEKRRTSQNLTKYINQHLKKLAIQSGLSADISTIWSRHSFASRSAKSGASVVLIQQSLGHTSLNTTMNYLDSFNDAELTALSNNLMDFNN